MATQNGVFYYDGYNFSKLKTDNLKSNLIRNLNFENNNIIIINREDGLFNYNQQLKTTSKIDSIRFNNPIDELVFSGDYIYSLTDQIRINSFNTKTKSISEDNLQKKNEFNQALCIYKTREGKVLSGRTNGLYFFNNDEQEKIDVLKNNPVYSICENHEGKLVIGSSNKIYIVNKNVIEKEITPKFKAKANTFLFSFEKSINKIISDKHGRIWFTVLPENNLYLYENNTLYDVFEMLNIKTSLINCITKDTDENIWIGTFNDGVYFIQNPFLYNVSFNLFGKNLVVNSVYYKNNYAYTATNNGLYTYNTNDLTVKTLSAPDEIFIEPIFNIAEYNNAVYYSKLSSGSNTNLNGIKINPVVSKYVYPINNKEAIIADGTATVLKINLKNQKVIDTIISFPDYRIRINSLLLKSDTLFLGTSNGLTLLNLKTKKYEALKDTAFNFSINDIKLLDNNIYIAHESGITIYNSKKLIRRIGEVGLAAVKKIKLKNNMLWLCTLDGLFICDSQLNPITVYNKATGLMSNSINDIWFDENKACIATDKGVSFSDIKTLSQKRSNPDPVKINYYEIDEVPSYNISEKIYLQSHQNDFSIYFSSPLFTKPNKQTFRYKLDKNKWVALDNMQIHLLSITGGKHSIQIIASRDNINWSDPVIIDIEKEIKFTETAGIYISITLGSLLLIITISYLWIKRVKKKALKRLAEEQQFNLLKHQSMNALLSPHFIFNSLTSIQNYINTNNSLMASEYLAKFSRLIRMIIEKASQSHILLKDEITRLNYYLDLEKERFKNKFDFEIKVQEGLDVSTISIPNMIIQPHAENSIIHGILPKNEHGLLKIHFYKNEKNELIITIEDNGIGIIKAKENAKANHKSLGTSTIANILELNAKLYNKKQFVKMEDKSLLNPPENGTVITITIEL